MTVTYSKAERAWLWVLCIVGFVPINGAFVYGLLHPEGLREALSNPVSAAFIAEALILLAALTWLLRKWGVSRLSRPMFVALSLAGGLAFALPIALLWRRKDPS
jgi:hypothetical protein